MVQPTSSLAVPCTVPVSRRNTGEAGVERARAVARRKFANLQVELDIAKAVKEVRGGDHLSVQVFSMGTPQDSDSFPSNEHFIGTPTGSDRGPCMGDTHIGNHIAFGDLLFSFIDSSDLAYNGRRTHGDCFRVADETGNAEADKDVSLQTSCVSSSPRRSGCRGNRSRGRSSSCISSSGRCYSSSSVTSSNRSNRSIGVSSSCSRAVCDGERVLKRGKRSRSSSACTASDSRRLSSEFPCLRAAALQNIAAANEALLQDVLKGPPLAFDGVDDMESDCDADLSCFDLELPYQHFDLAGTSFLQAPSSNC